MMDGMYRIPFIDSHTAGEPTRVVLDGVLDLGTGNVHDQLTALRTRYDWLRAAVVNEPRGSDVLVGALVCQPADSTCSVGVIFFNNVGYLGMCGHGTIGVVATLAYLGRIRAGQHRIETPVGVVTAELHDDGRVGVHNVASYRYAHAIAVDVPGHGIIHGDIAWGGNWFFITEDHRQRLEPNNVEALTEWSWRVRVALAAANITGAHGALIDHIELVGVGSTGTDGRNFVLCPGKAYDRSPCGTGTSAKVACLAADGKLAPGETWVQESIIGSRFTASYRREGDRVMPSITGEAFITVDGTLILDERDPFLWGLR
jgi:4-hydroxyproline epimerase